MFEATLDRGASDRGRSTKLWKHIAAEAGDDPRRGIFYYEDFQLLRSDDFTLTQATAGTFALDASVPSIGVGLLDCASSTAGQGGNLQFVGPIMQPAADRKIAFEARVKAADIATGPEFFAGLSIVDTTIIAASAVSASHYAGFSSITDDNVLLFGTKNGSTATNAASSPHTLVEDEYVKLGFLLDGLNHVEVFVNGSLWPHGRTTDFDAPAGSVLVPSFVNQSGGSTDPIAHLDWFAVGSNY